MDLEKKELSVIEERENVGSLSYFKMCKYKQQFLALSKSSNSSSIQFVTNQCEYEINKHLSDQINSTSSTQLVGVTNIWFLTQSPTAYLIVVSTYT